MLTRKPCKRWPTPWRIAARDGVGLYHEGHVGLLNTRLAIIDVAHGDQPFITPKGSVLVANGEIYNDLTTRAAMTDVAFKTGSDCEPPLYLYERHGVDYASHLRGMYGIAIYDKARDCLILSRDPMASSSSIMSKRRVRSPSPRNRRR